MDAPCIRFLKLLNIGIVLLLYNILRKIKMNPPSTKNMNPTKTTEMLIDLCANVELKRLKKSNVKM
jgi:hypothetical protein